MAILWLFAFERFSADHDRRNRNRYRIDHQEAVAYPASDAASDFANSLAILSGDGWVDWRGLNRWTVYKPGWAAILAGLGVVCSRDLAAMQLVLTAAYAAAVPLLYLLVVSLFPSPVAPVVAAFGTMLYVLYPFPSWWFQKTMMSEGPTLLLSLVFCLLAVRFVVRGGWPWWKGFVLGLAAAPICLVRSQSRYAVAAVFVLLTFASLRRWRTRLPFLVMFILGLLALAGPYYFKTSYHLGRLNLGTSYFDLRGSLVFSPAGKRVGEGKLNTLPDSSNEAEVMGVLAGRLRQAVWRNLQSPERVFRQAMKGYQRTLYGGTAKLYRTRTDRPTFRAVCLLLTLAGLGWGLRKRGVAALIPIVYFLAYLAPCVLLSFWGARFGAPVAWVGTTYLIGGLLLLLELPLGAGTAERVASSASPEDGSGRWRSSRVTAPWGERGAPLPEAGAAWPRPLLVMAIGVWVVIASTLLVRFDLSPPPTVEVSGLLTGSRSQDLLSRAGLEVDAGLIEEIDRVVNHGWRSDRAILGVAFMPFVMEPGDRPVTGDWAQLQPGDKVYTTFILVSPWKSGGNHHFYAASVVGRLYEGFRHGDRVLVIHSGWGPTRQVNSRFDHLRAEAVIPLRWAEF